MMCTLCVWSIFFFFKQKTAYEMRISDWSSDVCSSDLTDACLRQRVVYFDFDKTEIKPEFQQITACHAKYLQDRPTSHIRLEGNTDERGTREYNLGLGERRGNAVSEDRTSLSLTSSHSCVARMPSYACIQQSNTLLTHSAPH